MNVSLMNGMSLSKMFNTYGGTNQQDGPSKLSEDIAFLLKQEKGKFYADPDFGSMLYSYLFLPLTEETGHMIKQEVYNTISKFYPQITLQYVNVTMRDKEIKITVGYSYSDSDNPTELDVSIIKKI